MPEAIWKPHVTVAAIGEREGKFLLVREKVKGRIVINQPAGHLEENETLIEAVIRETLEETQYQFTPTGLQGIYRSRLQEGAEITYLRFLFTGDVGVHLNGQLDEGIISAEWLSYDEVKACQSEHRSPLVMQCINDYLNHPPCSLNVISQLYA
jgi:8-oxo-dGTP pyrophosphatase MutT (NUDIX family)